MICDSFFGSPVVDSPFRSFYSSSSLSEDDIRFPRKKFGLLYLLPNYLPKLLCAHVIFPQIPFLYTLHLLFSEVELMLSRFRQVLICDININFLASSPLTSRFNNTLSVLNLKQVISIPTRVTPTSI